MNTTQSNFLNCTFMIELVTFEAYTLKHIPTVRKEN